MMTMIVRPEHISQLPTLPLFVKSMQHHPHVQTLVRTPGIVKCNNPLKLNLFGLV